MDQMKRQRDMGERTNTRLLTYEDFQPSTDWTHDLNCHVLLVDLPGFKKEELKVQVDNSWKVTITGERKVSENKYCRFKQISDVPKDSDINKISGRFDGGLLFVIIPKKKAGEKLEEPKNMNQNVKDIVKEKNEELQKEEYQKKKNDNKHEKKDEMETVGLKQDLTAQKSETKDMGEEREIMKEKGKEVVKHLAENAENAEEIISKTDDGLRKEGEILKEQGKEVAGDFTANAKKVISKHDGWRKEGEDITEKGKEIMEGFMENAKGTISKKGGWSKEREVVKEKGKEVVEVVEDFMGNAKEIISNNKVAIATAVFAFSIGVLYISHRLRSGGQ
ncbi:hypothetical protein MKX01_032392 [Papaver californicum]|nr:hypothetical protein MKX01_032392 [Papaver californicum]